MYRHQVVVFLAAALASTCLVASTSDDKKTFVPPDAKDLRERNVGNGRQLSFDVIRSYPDSGWSTDSLAKAESRGWRRCSGPEFGKWKVFGDKASTQARLVHEQSLMFAKENRALILIGRYYSSLPQGGYPLSIRPETDLQHVTVMEIGGTEQQMEKTKSMYDANCK